eukprot:s917_g24.t1
MPTGSGEPAQAADPGGQGSGSLTSLPWAQIPKFDPSSTDLRVYEQKMKFLRAIWPEEFLPHLAPRAALLVEGPAFQKVSRLDGNKLRSPDGVQYLVEALGGTWGRLATEEKFDLFERALFTVVQKQDESNDSYLSRHDIAFEDLEAKGVTFKDIRAYVLVRQSTLSSEDRKKIIMDNAGDLTYEAARKSMRLLGSRFFQDLQGPGKSQVAKKAYDAYHTEEPDDPVPTFFQDADGEWDEESAYQLLADSGDEDAIYINEFEDQIVEALQEHPELSQCFVSYQEARARVRERAKARGFWPLKGKSKGKTGSKKGKGGFQYGGGVNFGGGFMGRKRSLADRIANSTCRLCGAAGHWKRECPMRPENKKPDQTAPNEIHFGFLDEDDIAPEESAYQLLADSGDEDAIYINEFEDQIVEALQEHPELSQCFVSYQEARARVRERAKARGFWPLKGKSKGKTGSKKGKGGFQYGGGANFGGGFMGRKRSLADRIANSTCRLCGAAGHWKRECPMRPENKKPDQTAPNEIHFGFLDEDDIAPEVIYELPSNATDWEEGLKLFPSQQILSVSNQVEAVPKKSQRVISSYQQETDSIGVYDELLLVEVPKIDTKFTQNLCKRLQNCGRKNLESAVAIMHDRPPSGQFRSAQTKHPPDIPASPKSGVEAEPVFQFEEQSHEAIIDTGASRAVIGNAKGSDVVQANQELAIPKNQLPTPAEVFQRPPEVNTLRDWGKLVMPDGKHRGKTFEQAFADQNYVFQLKNRRATSAWVKNFQMYSRCRVHYDYAHSKEMYEKGIPVTTEMLSQMVSQPADQAIVPSEIPKAKAQSSKSNCPDDWTQVEEVPIKKAEISKRTASQVSGKTSQRSMSMEPDTEKINRLQTQIALLQRELAKETQIPSDAEEG